MKENSNSEYHYVNFPVEVFGININSLSKEKVVCILESKKIKYFSYYPYEVDVPSKLKDSLIITNYFIGTGLDTSKIIKIEYDFSKMGISQNIIGIQFDYSYYETLLKLLTEKYGPCNKKLMPLCKGDKDTYNFVWGNSRESKSSLDEIVVAPNNLGEGFFFYMYGKELDEPH